MNVSFPTKPGLGSVDERAIAVPCQLAVHRAAHQLEGQVVVVRVRRHLTEAGRRLVQRRTGVDLEGVIWGVRGLVRDRHHHRGRLRT